jgi:outer membrane protein OmpA-like peptidoglycan-associated protein
MKIQSSMVLGASLVLTACAINPKTGQPEIAPSVKDSFNSTFNSDDPCSNNSRNVGMLVGGVAGAAVGYLTHGIKGGIAGGAAGVAAGFVIGHVLDSRRCELSKIAAANGLKLASMPIRQQGDSTTLSPPAGALSTSAAGKQDSTSDSDLGLDVQVQNKSDEFVRGTAQLTPQARAYMSQIAAQYAPKMLLASLPSDATLAQRQKALNRKVLIVGHTDEQDAVSSHDLAALSQQRAKAVAKVFADEGVPASNVYYQGAGDSLPIESNLTTDGREANQRTQIIDVPTESDLQKYLARRNANPVNFRFADTTTVKPSIAASGSSASLISDKHATAAVVTSMPATERAHATPSSTAKAAGPALARVGREPAVVSPVPAANTMHVAAAAGDYDFGGRPTVGNGMTVSLGAAPQSTFSLISSANAAQATKLDSCLGDRPHASSDVRNLATDLPLNVRDYLPGFYGAPWATSMGGNLVSLFDVRVPSDAGSPIPEPKLQIFKDYKGNPKQKPSFSARVPVNVYRGSDATLYRVFVNGPMQCLDLVVPNQRPLASGNIYYSHRDLDYTATGNFALMR